MIRPDLSTPSNWTYRNELYGQQVQILNELKPIPIMNYDPLFFSPTLLIEVTVNGGNSPSSWRFGGTIEQYIPIGPGLGNDSYVRTNSRGLNIGTNIIRFPDLATDSYRIRFLPPRWFFSVLYRFFEYTGDGHPSTEGKLDALYDELFPN